MSRFVAEALEHVAGLAPEVGADCVASGIVHVEPAQDGARSTDNGAAGRGAAGMARQAGFDIDLLSPFNTMLFPLIAGVRLLNKMRGHDSADDALPAKPVNRALDTLFGAEAGLIGRLPFPFGVSLVAVLRRPATARRPS